MADIRITAGTLRGRRIAVPPAGIRPTAERARQAFFNITASRIPESRFLDLFAGTGVFAFEAVSRGAASAVAIDSLQPNTLAIQKLARTWDAPVTAMTGDVLRTLDGVGPYDLAYVDPPYDYDSYDELMAVLDTSALAGNGLIAIEHRRKTDPFQFDLQRLHFTRRGEYGEVWISFFEPAGTTTRDPDEGAPE